MSSINMIELIQFDIHLVQSMNVSEYAKLYTVCRGQLILFQRRYRLILNNMAEYRDWVRRKWDLKGVFCKE